MNMRGLVLPAVAGLLLCTAARAETSVGTETQEALDAAGRTLKETGEAVAAGAGRAADAVGDALGDTGRAAAAFGADATGSLSEALRDLSTEDAGTRVVVDDRGEEIGEVEKIVRSDDGLFAVVEAGGFLGIGESEVVVPADRFEAAGDGRLRLPGETRETLEGFERYDAARFGPAPGRMPGGTSDTARGE